jgi:hypothetical protein
MIRISKRATPVKTGVEGMSARNDPLAGIRSFSHELVNQLTVINLSCGKIRKSMPTLADESIAREFERIALTVEECVKTLEKIAQHENARNVPRRHLRSMPDVSAGNVFPLFELLEKSR